MIRRTVISLSAGLACAFMTAADAQESRSIALILDASGSMNAKLAGGQTRIEAAKAAVGAFVEKLDPKVRLSYRAYGHQSPTKDKNCKDTELLVDFGPAGANREAILAKTKDVKAQGYTPITYVIQLAAAEVGKEPGARAVVLVSDGKETCKEFPSMSSFRSMIELPAGFYNVTFGPTVWKSVEVKGGETTVLDPGTIEVRNASPSGHKVLDWETGVAVGQISSFTSRVTVLPSTFTVTFGAAEWKHIEVKAGEHKVLNPAVIVVHGADAGKGHNVRAEDGTLAGNISSFASQLPVPPGKYTIEIGDQKVPLDLAEGQKMEINLR